MLKSNIEKINDHFKIPISYNIEKIELNPNIITDLELIETVDPSGITMYDYTFQPKTNRKREYSSEDSTPNNIN